MTFVNKVVKAAGKAVQLSEELESMFDGNKTKLARFVKKLVNEFGENVSMLDVYKKVAGFTAPTKTFDGATYVAGNSWPYLVPEGKQRDAKLLDVVVVDNKVKLLFGIDGLNIANGCCYLYETLESASAVQAVNYTKSIGSFYEVHVRHDYVEAIDEYKAVVSESFVY